MNIENIKCAKKYDRDTAREKTRNADSSSKKNELKKILFFLFHFKHVLVFKI